ncbi:hypothetical protein BHC59_04275 [Snodgrassella alvi]|jgi:hypothetical protein|nr:hypothetical protein BHC59_04275 [Snodgrassella alvi]
MVWGIQLPINGVINRVVWKPQISMLKATGIENHKLKQMFAELSLKSQHQEEIMKKLYSTNWDT